MSFACSHFICPVEATPAQTKAANMLNDSKDSAAAPVNDEAGHQPTVLVFEDNELTTMGIATTLVNEGYLVLTAATGHDALESLRQPLSPIDVVILDVHLPDASGIDICARLRELYPHLPVIVCTGEATPEEVVQLLRLGVHRYFQKPISPDELLAAVEAALS
jgi:two-component system nitrogen regulation response regulator NtrX